MAFQKTASYKPNENPYPLLRDVRSFIWLSSLQSPATTLPLTGSSRQIGVYRDLHPASSNTMPDILKNKKFEHMHRPIKTGEFSEERYNFLPHKNKKVLRFLLEIPSVIINRLFWLEFVSCPGENVCRTSGIASFNIYRCSICTRFFILSGNWSS